jgi:hypothetical protein
MAIYRMSIKTFVIHEINFVPLITLISHEDDASVIVRPYGARTLLDCPLPTIGPPGGHSWLARIVGSDGELKSEKLQFHSESREVPPRSLNGNFT